jgi:hypothetical protein
LERNIDGKTPPDVVLDTTQAGDGSDAVKSLARSLGLPTVALSYGGVGEIRFFHFSNPNSKVSFSIFMLYYFF